MIKQKVAAQKRNRIFCASRRPDGDAGGGKDAGVRSTQARRERVRARNEKVQVDKWVCTFFHCKLIYACERIFYLRQIIFPKETIPRGLKLCPDTSQSKANKLRLRNL